MVLLVSCFLGAAPEFQVLSLPSVLIKLYIANVLLQLGIFALSAIMMQLCVKCFWELGVETVMISCKK